MPAPGGATGRNAWQHSEVLPGDPATASFDEDASRGANQIGHLELRSCGTRGIWHRACAVEHDRYVAANKPGKLWGQAPSAPARSGPPVIRAIDGVGDEVQRLLR